MPEIKSAYHGEAQLIRWGDGPQGHTVTLRLSSDPNAINPFKGLPLGDNGQRMQIACVLVDDHDEPTDPDHAKANSRRRKAATKDGPDKHVVAELSPYSKSVSASPIAAEGEGQDKPRTRKRSEIAALKCQDRDFFGWLSYHPAFNECARDIGRAVSDSEFADYVIKRILGISSKKELDTDPLKAAEWDKLITSFEVRAYARQGS